MTESPVQKLRKLTAEFLRVTNQQLPQSCRPVSVVIELIRNVLLGIDFDHLHDVPINTLKEIQDALYEARSIFNDVLNEVLSEWPNSACARNGCTIRVRADAAKCEFLARATRATARDNLSGYRTDYRTTTGSVSLDGDASHQARVPTDFRSRNRRHDLALYAA